MNTEFAFSKPVIRSTRRGFLRIGGEVAGATTIIALTPRVTHGQAEVAGVRTRPLEEVKNFLDTSERTELDKFPFEVDGQEHSLRVTILPGANYTIDSTQDQEIRQVYAASLQRRAVMNRFTDVEIIGLPFKAAHPDGDNMGSIGFTRLRKPAGYFDGLRLDDGRLVLFYAPPSDFTKDTKDQEYKAAISGLLNGQSSRLTASGVDLFVPLDGRQTEEILGTPPAFDQVFTVNPLI